MLALPTSWTPRSRTHFITVMKILKIQVRTHSWNHQENWHLCSLPNTYINKIKHKVLVKMLKFYFSLSAIMTPAPIYFPHLQPPFHAMLSPHHINSPSFLTQPLHVRSALHSRRLRSASKFGSEVDWLRILSIGRFGYPSEGGLQPILLRHQGKAVSSFLPPCPSSFTLKLHLGSLMLLKTPQLLGAPCPPPRCLSHLCLLPPALRVRAGRSSTFKTLHKVISLQED